jgi:putative alpha-1,2-mannosidase
MYHPDETDDDYAAYILALHLGKPQTITDFLYERAMRTPFLIYNNATGFMEARNANGTWAGPDNGWTEGMYLRVIFMDLLIVFLWLIKR